MILPRESVPRKLWPIPILLIPTGNKRTVTDPDHRQIFLEHTKNHESDEINTPLLNLNLKKVNRLVSWSHYFSLLMSIWLSFGKKSVRSQQTEERERQKTFSIQQSQTFCMSSIQPHFKTSTTELLLRLRRSWGQGSERVGTSKWNTLGAKQNFFGKVGHAQLELYLAQWA